MAVNPLLATKPPNIGNFSLASSQQPGPFFSFGQNIVDKKQLIFAANPSYLYSQTQSILEGTPSLLDGITDSSSLLLTITLALNYKNGNQNLSGMGDLVIPRKITDVKSRIFS
ncbi:MAG: hypothetical protein ACRCXC_10400 [Legionella sp.]